MNIMQPSLAQMHVQPGANARLARSTRPGARARVCVCSAVKRAEGHGSYHTWMASGAAAILSLGSAAAVQAETKLAGPLESVVSGVETVQSALPTVSSHRFATRS